MDGRALKQAVYVLGLAAVPAQQAVVAENPQIAWLRCRSIRRGRHVVGIGQTLLHVAAHQPRQFLLVEAQQVKIEIHLLQRRQLDGQQFVVPLGDGSSLVVGDAVGFNLRFAQVRGDVDRHLRQAQLLRCLPTGVPDDDHAFTIHDDGLAEPELP